MHNKVRVIAEWCCFSVHLPLVCHRRVVLLQRSLTIGMSVCMCVHVCVYVYMPSMIKVASTVVTTRR